jgi:hypothetical protein
MASALTEAQACSLRAFLRDRILEDQVSALATGTADVLLQALRIAPGMFVPDPDRMLTEVRAKRRVLDAWLARQAELDALAEWEDSQWAGGALRAAEDAARAVAAVYASHPLYRAVWAPPAFDPWAADR